MPISEKHIAWPSEMGWMLNGARRNYSSLGIGGRKSVDLKNNCQDAWSDKSLAYKRQRKDITTLTPLKLHHAEHPGANQR